MVKRKTGEVTCNTQRVCDKNGIKKKKSKRVTKKKKTKGEG